MEITEIDGRITELTNQRNAAQNSAVIFAGQLAERDARIAALTASLALLKPKAEEPGSKA